MLADEGVLNEVQLYLQELTHITAPKLHEFLTQTEFMEKHGIIKPITPRTAERYLEFLGYRFGYGKKGQYADGHERADVVQYRDYEFLPKWAELLGRSFRWDKDGNLEAGPRSAGRRIIFWYHDESIFYAHDRRMKSWHHKDGDAKIYPKGDGVSFMVAEFISADFGYLQAPDGRSARRVLRPGKNRDGYFTNDEILEQANAAMDLCQELWPEFEHVFVYDNAKTHCKRAEDALSARYMPKSTREWLVDATKRDESGKVMHGPDGKIVKHKVHMANGIHNGQPQSLYYENGLFKGMDAILHERGYNTTGLLAQCKQFKCNPLAIDCCLR